MEAFKSKNLKKSFDLGWGNKFICEVFNDSELLPVAINKWSYTFQNLQWGKIFQKGDVQLPFVSILINL